MRKIASLFCLSLVFAKIGYCQSDSELVKITVGSIPASGSVYMLYGENGFGGGNVAASIGADGILLVDDMYRAVVPQMKETLKKLSSADIRIIVNSHFHGDHIQGNMALSKSAIIIGHENVFKRLNSNPKSAAAGALPHVLVTDSMTIHFNGEDIRLLHFPNGHTDTDLMIWFTKSSVIHMGDTYFNGMFPAVYKEGGGDILQMIRNLDKILAMLPDNIKVIPGHGELASKSDLQAYVLMLKETTAAIQSAIKSGKSLDDVQKAKLIQKYDKLGSGGAQTTEQYTAMLYKLLS